MSGTPEQLAVAIFGNGPVSTGSGTKTFSEISWAYETDEETVIDHFYDKDGNAVITGWEGETIGANKFIYFGKVYIKSMHVVSGGKGSYYKAQ